MMRMIKQKITACGKKITVACLIGIAATLIDNGIAFYHAFKVKSKDVTQEQMKNVFTENVELIIVDEVSMIPSDFIVMMDRKLRQVYDSSMMFGEEHILLSGDFLQMKPIGTSICKSLCLCMSNTDVNCRSLISSFKVFHIEQQVRSKCKSHMKCLKQFRTLPKNIPLKQRGQQMIEKISELLIKTPCV